MNSCDIWISYEYHMKIIWISYEYHVNILKPCILIFDSSNLQPVSRYLERCWTVARYVDLNLPGFEALGTTNIASGEPGELAALLIPAIGGKIVGSFSQIFTIIFWHFIFEYSWHHFDINNWNKKPGLQSPKFDNWGKQWRQWFCLIILRPKECQLEGLAHHSWQYGGGGLRGHRSWMFLPGPADQVFNLLRPRFL